MQAGRPSRSHPVVEVIGEDPDEALEFLFPEIVLVALVALLRARVVARRPFPPTVKEITKEQHRVRLQRLLNEGKRPAKILIGVFHRERRQRPRTARISVRIDELRVCNESDVMRRRFLRLFPLIESVYFHLNRQPIQSESRYPLLP